MAGHNLQAKAQEMLSVADVRVNGDRPWDITVHDNHFFGRVMEQGSLGLGESYMDGWWDCAELDQFFCHILSADLDRTAAPRLGLALAYLKALLFNAQTKSRATVVAERHYDLGNDLYRNMLDNRMVYTSGHWDAAADLDAAQEAKLEYVCQQLRLQPDMKLLDIGCGWGSLAKYAAEKYGVEAVGITLSREQLELGRQMCEGLPVTLRLQDYRDVHEEFDRVASLGMFEHVGYKNYRTYMEVVRRALKKGGRFYLSTIGENLSVRFTDPWIEKYIFPNSHLPSIAQIGRALEGIFVMEHWGNRGHDYDKTLLAWFGNFRANWDGLKARYGERFFRMWKYYLLASAGSFRSRKNQLWEIVLTPEGGLGC